MGKIMILCGAIWVAGVSACATTMTQKPYNMVEESLKTSVDSVVQTVNDMYKEKSVGAEPELVFSHQETMLFTDQSVGVAQFSVRNATTTLQSTYVFFDCSLKYSCVVIYALNKQLVLRGE